MPKNKYDDTLTLLRALSAEAAMLMGLSNTRQRQRLIQELAALVKVCRQPPLDKVWPYLACSALNNLASAWALLCRVCGSFHARQLVTTLQFFITDATFLSLTRRAVGRLSCAVQGRSCAIGELSTMIAAL